MADFILSDAGIAAQVTLDAVRSFGLGGPAAETGTHKLLAGISAQATCLRVAVLHALLLRVDLGAPDDASAAIITITIKYPFIGNSLPSALKRAAT